MNRKKIESQTNEWSIAIQGIKQEDEGRREALFALGNGYIVTRSCLTQYSADTYHYPGTYRAGCYNRLESEIQGDLVETESLVNLPNWTLIQIYTEDQSPFTVKLDDAEHLQCLDLHCGVFNRSYTLVDETGRQLHLRERRLVSMDDPHVAAVSLEIRPLGWSGPIVLDSLIDVNIENKNIASFEDYQHRHLLAVHEKSEQDGIAVAHVRTVNSNIHIIQVTRTTLQCSSGIKILDTPIDGGHRYTVNVFDQTPLVIEKICVLETSAATPNETSANADTSDPDWLEVIDKLSAKVKALGRFVYLEALHAKAWDQLWKRAAVRVDDSHIAPKLRFDIFHILQTYSPHSTQLDVGIPARGWHGEGYHGHAFWDELFVMSFLTMQFPEVAKSHLMYRCRRLAIARDAATKAGHDGAMYPWRSAQTGEEVTLRYQKNMLSGDYSRDHTCLQRHVGTAVAFDIWRYYLATGDQRFLCNHGAEVILEIARFLASIAIHRDEDDRFEIRGVVGPDEYHTRYPWRDTPGLDNNAFTNVMAAWVLSRGQDVLNALPPLRCAELRTQIDLQDDELALWDRISRRMYVPFQPNGIINQFDGFDLLAKFDEKLLPDEWRDERTDWALHAAGHDVNGYQIIKQADALTIFYLLSDREVSELFLRMGYTFDSTCILESAEHYLACSAHQSSLSRIVYAGALAGHDNQTAWKLYCEILETDLDQLKGESVNEGIHLAAMGGAIDVLVRHFHGLHFGADCLIVEPAVPDQLGDTAINFLYHGNSLSLLHREEKIILRSAEGNQDVRVRSYGKLHLLKAGAELEFQSNAFVN